MRGGRPDAWWDRERMTRGRSRVQCHHELPYIGYVSRTFVDIHLFVHWGKNSHGWGVLNTELCVQHWGGGAFDLNHMEIRVWLF